MRRLCLEPHAKGDFKAYVATGGSAGIYIPMGCKELTHGCWRRPESVKQKAAMRLVALLATRGERGDGAGDCGGVSMMRDLWNKKGSRLPWTRLWCGKRAERPSLWALHAMALGAAK